MNSFIKFFLLLFLCFTETILANNDSSKVIFSDNPVVARFDSLLMINYSAYQAMFSSNIEDEGFEPPDFSDTIYESRIQQLNTKTPIELVYNTHVKQYINVYNESVAYGMHRLLLKNNVDCLLQKHIRKYPYNNGDIEIYYRLSNVDHKIIENDYAWATIYDIQKKYQKNIDVYISKYKFGLITNNVSVYC